MYKISDMKTKSIECILGRPEKVIKKYGYEYHLVECGDRGERGLRNACALGFPGWALRSVNKAK